MSGDEVELLLKITNDYKVEKVTQGVDWESCQSKFTEILTIYKEQYPSEEQTTELGKEFLHSVDEITKGIHST